MKNFPHQYSDVGRFRSTLEIIRQLTAARENVSDDAVLGYALARAGVYNFRGDVPDLELRIASEQQKAPGRQGARTAAREGRRTLRLLGLVGSDGELTASGTGLLATLPGSPSEMLIWRQSLIELSLVGEAGSISHPMRILLRLLFDRGPLARINLALALEARDDSAAEYERILSLLPIRDAIQRGELHVSHSMLDNAVKILPAFALQLGMALDRGDDLLIITEIGEALLRLNYQAGDVAVRLELGARVPRRVARPGRAVEPRDRIVPQVANFAGLSLSEQIDAIRLQMERTARHEVVVQKVVAAFQGDFAVLEDRNSYDVLLVPHDQGNSYMLLEVKTLDLDEITQTNRAVGQLLWYLWQYVSLAYPNVEIRLGVVFDRRPSNEVSSYLENLSIACIYCEELRFEACNDAARELLPDPRDIPENYAAPPGV